MLRSAIQTLSLVKNVKKMSTNKSTMDTKSTSTSMQNDNKHFFDANLHITTAYDKRILVLARKYPSMKDVPDKVSLDVMQAAMSRIRIRIANLVMIGTVIVCLVFINRGEDEKNTKLNEMKIEQDNIRREIIAGIKADAKETPSRN